MVSETEPKTEPKTSSWPLSVAPLLSPSKKFLNTLKRSLTPSLSRSSSTDDKQMLPTVAEQPEDFRLLFEATPIECSEAFVAPFSLPAEAFSFQPLPEQTVCTYKGGDKERRIHCNIELTASELDNLAALKGEAGAQGAAFYPSVAAMATRFISRARGDPKKALKFMQATQAWREAYFKNGPLSGEDVSEDMNNGIVYFTGRDQALRPAIVVRPGRIPQHWWKEKRVDKVMRLIIFCMEYFLRYMVVPGRVENLSVIADMRGVGLAQCNLSFLSELNGVLSHHYLGRVCYFYVLNMPSSLRFLASAVKKLLTDRQQQKIQILDDAAKLRASFAPHQLEEDMGGTRPTAEAPQLPLQPGCFFPFPLLPGPFDCYAEGADMEAQPGMHEVLTVRGAMGRLWDPSKSLEANVELVYSDKAAELLLKCGLAPSNEEEGNADLSECLACGGAGCGLCRRLGEDKQECPVLLGSQQLADDLNKGSCTNLGSKCSFSDLKHVHIDSPPDYDQPTSQSRRWGGMPVFSCLECMTRRQPDASTLVSTSTLSL